MDGLLENPSALQLVLIALALVCAWLWWKLHNISEENVGLQREYDRARDKNENLQRPFDERKEQHESALGHLRQTSKEREDDLASEVRKLRDELDDARSEKRQLETQQRNDREKLTFLDEAEKRLGVTFKDVASNVLQDTRESLVQTFDQKQENAKQDLQHRQNAIQEMVRPIDQSLKDLQEANTSLKASMSTRLEEVVSASNRLQNETTKLATALRRPEVRGSWGELILNQCVEFTGMKKYVSYLEQSETDDNKRADMIVRLPNKRQIIVDSKAPLDAYSDACNTQDENVRTVLLKKHASQVREKVKALSSKKYQDKYTPSPDFVVMFLPHEGLFSAALEQEPELIQFGIQGNVLIATPTTLIALLRAVHMGWREVEMAEHAREISRLGEELHNYTRTLLEHVDDIRKGLARSVNAYNKTVGSLDNRFIPKAKQLGEKISTRDETLQELKTIPAEIRESRHLEALNGIDEGKNSKQGEVQ
ncbi:MAG: DNA recombination protein RmuC [Anaerolineaceae bacterium]|nr:DNA recombination protein RmuC [Anaerolineaceae bacterium]